MQEGSGPLLPGPGVDTGVLGDAGLGQHPLLLQFHLVSLAGQGGMLRQESSALRCKQVLVMEWRPGSLRGYDPAAWGLQRYGRLYPEHMEVRGTPEL